MRALRTLFVIVVAAGLAWFGWSQWQARKTAENRADKAERTLGIAASRVVFIAFERAADLRVATITGKIIARGGYEGLIFHPRQETAAPFTLDYFLPLASMGKSAYHWDAMSKTLTIDAPDVTTAPPNIDMAKSVTRQEGVYISREAGLAMARQAYRRISSTASAEGKKSKFLSDARESGRQTLERMARQTLGAVGVTGAKVAVSYPWEPKVRSQNDEHWDESRSIQGGF